ncbi:mandelate racemase/muconate lactonizing enzyme family protein [Marinobacterium rhizophilum]|uniref:Mandelate racemase/muconate lactonizing enzyme family protein n=1 Tax=Marinobacterium rhizophilum TaxID=420402 RepID=A0ABY5HNB8_9GAMM|nr:mandelate racemase/muconate lactonizing enzyme family protein [Marinobacterium rhizophilum]UTW13068.1 mandelate racemase/muconate lactonizing enzyme family protein [Marinobacterium rhizophilum]
MKISKISVYQVSLPFARGAYRLSGGRSFEALDSTVVEIETDAGLTGWGETCPFGISYLPGFAAGARAGIAELAPVLIGEDPRKLGNINRLMDKTLKGQFYLKSALDLACWDILGKATGMPVYDLLGGMATPRMPIVASVSDTPTAAEMIADIEHFRARGYSHYSAKASGDPDKDISQFRAVAQVIQPGEVLMVDANTGWKQHAALRVMRALREFDLYIESPCASYEETLSVRRQTDHPMILDEVMQGLDIVLRASRDDAADVMNLKVSKVGGLTKARLIKELCVEMGIALTIQDTGGGAFAQAAIAHLAHATPTELLLNVWDCTEMSDVTFGDEGVQVENGYMRASGKPGLGVEPRMAVLGEPVAVYGADHQVSAGH